MIQANGLLTSNSWAGYHVLLNPEYSGSTQWRFVNRAIDEVENDRVRSLHALLTEMPVVQHLSADTAKQAANLLRGVLVDATLESQIQKTLACHTSCGSDCREQFRC